MAILPLPTLDTPPVHLASLTAGVAVCDMNEEKWNLHPHRRTADVIGSCKPFLTVLTVYFFLCGKLSYFAHDNDNADECTQLRFRVVCISLTLVELSFILD